MKHTEGPFYAINYAGYWNIQSGPYYGDTNLLDEEKCKNAKNNAELLVKAPELLAAINKFLNIHDLWCPGEGNIPDEQHEAEYRVLRSVFEELNELVKPLNE